MDEQSKRGRKSYSEEFKRDAVRLVVMGWQWGDSLATALVGRALRLAIESLRPPRGQY
jgi:transposase-like protein